MVVRFGSGYSLVVRCEDPGAARAALECGLEGAWVREQHHCQLCLQLPPATASLPAVFRLLELLRGRGLLQDYSLTQVSHLSYRQICQID